MGWVSEGPFLPRTMTVKTKYLVRACPWSRDFLSSITSSCAADGQVHKKGQNKPTAALRAQTQKDGSQELMEDALADKL